jgi:hypothetical protein
MGNHAMDDDTLSLLKTICAAGRAREGYDDNANAKLEQLAEEGLLHAVDSASVGRAAKTPRLSYQPTERAHALLRKLGAA